MKGQKGGKEIYTKMKSICSALHIAQFLHYELRDIRFKSGNVGTLHLLSYSIT